MSNLSSNETSHTDDGDTSGDDFVMLDEPRQLAIRSREPSPNTTPRIQLTICEESSSFLVSLDPPAASRERTKRASCDIVLVIDVSGSMATLAPLPDVASELEQNKTNLTVLDLVRHACRTIISTLEEGDRLALVTFSQEATVVQSLTSMTDTAKAATLDKVEKLQDEGATNLWAGIKTGIKQFGQHPPKGNVQGVFVLTDGQPNFMCPLPGYVTKLRPLLNNLAKANGSTPTIQTFGFGYDIRSDLMLSIAKVGNGNYAFMPEVGMIGTVFVHAVANLYATYATNAVLELSHSGPSDVVLQHNSGLPARHADGNKLMINLGNIMYGQSRDTVVSFPPQLSRTKPSIKTRLTYTIPGGTDTEISETFSPHHKSTLRQTVLNYHLLRNELCCFFSKFYPLNEAIEEHTTLPMTDDTDAVMDFQIMLTKITSTLEHVSDPNISSILSDMVGPCLNVNAPEEGQVFQSLKTAAVTKGNRVYKSYWQRWGRHYLSSLWCAHMRQTCNSFKDAGPLRYGIESEIFKRCRDQLDQAFDNLPAPVGTYRHHNSTGPVSGTTTSGSALDPQSIVSMRRYNRSDNPCFLGSCLVKMAGGQEIRVEELKVGMVIHGPLTDTAQRVAGIVKSVGVAGQDICRVSDGLWITPWHPILDPNTQKWMFPIFVAEELRELRDGEHVYSILLEAQSYDANAHAIGIEGITCVTLGHGIIHTTSEDVRAHPFFGNHKRIKLSLSGLSTDEEGRWLCGGVIRDVQTGLSCGLFGASAQTNSDYVAEAGDIVESSQRAKL